MTETRLSHEGVRPPPTEEELQDRMRRYGVPDAYARYSRDTWDAKIRPFPEVLETWRGDPWGLALLGTTGTGKTLGAAIVFRRALVNTWPRPAPCRWLYLPQALEAVKDGFSATPESEGYRRAEGIRQAAKTAALVVFDDLGAELGEWGSQQAQTWIEMRHAAGLATVVTSNAKDLDALRRSMPRVASRLSEGVRAGTVLAFAGRDLRSRAGAATVRGEAESEWGLW